MSKVCGIIGISAIEYLRFFTCVSWGISPAQILLIVQTTAIRHSIFYFSSFSMFLPVFFFALYLFHPILFYSSFYSLFCFLPLFLHFIFWSPLLFSYPFFLFSYYSILSTSPLCSITIRSVLFVQFFRYSVLKGLMAWEIAAKFVSHGHAVKIFVASYLPLENIIHCLWVIVFLTVQWARHRWHFGNSLTVCLWTNCLV